MQLHVSTSGSERSSLCADSHSKRTHTASSKLPSTFAITCKATGGAREGGCAVQHGRALWLVRAAFQLSQQHHTRSPLLVPMSRLLHTYDLG